MKRDPCFTVEVVWCRNIGEGCKLSLNDTEELAETFYFLLPTPDFTVFLPVVVLTQLALGCEINPIPEMIQVKIILLSALQLKYYPCRALGDQF